MQKSKLDRFIQKYNLGGNVNSVKWKSSGDTLTTSFVTPDKSLLGNVKVDKFPFEDAELGVYQTDQLKSLIGVLGDDVSLDVSRAGDKAYSLKVKNGPVSVDYVLSDLSVIADPPALIDDELINDLNQYYEGDMRRTGLSDPRHDAAEWSIDEDS